MAEELKALIEKIQEEGVNTAREKARKIEEDARRQAEAITAKARKDADSILVKAKEDIAKAEEGSRASNIRCLLRARRLNPAFFSQGFTLKE